jgi:alpha-mannosidase
MVKKFILVFKTHFDIGFTNLSSKVIDEYADSMLRDVIITCKATQHMELTGHQSLT